MVANDDRFGRVETLDGRRVVEPGAMVIDADDIDLGPLYLAVAAGFLVVTVVALMIALVAQRLGRRRFGCVSMVVAVVVTVAGAVVALVVSRIAGREATTPDVLWALAMVAVGTLCLRILLTPADRHGESRP